MSRNDLGASLIKIIIVYNHEILSCNHTICSGKMVKTLSHLSMCDPKKKKSDNFPSETQRLKSVHLVLGIGRVQYASGLFACVDHHPYHRACQGERQGK